MYFKTCLIFFPFFVTTIFAQISGYVVDETTGNPIPNVNVITESTGTSTDDKGAFTLDVPNGTPLKFTHIGYHDTTHPAQQDMVISLFSGVIQSDKIIVRAGLTDESIQKVAASVSVFNKDDIRKSAASHFQTLTDQVPNLNWAGGTSRPRYFQIRGIGERSHYFGEGAPNFSVGFVFDDMDLSGLGMVAQLYDMDQIEIFKGPQSTVFGANAMGGLISLRSNDPVDSFKMGTILNLGSDNHYGGHGYLNMKLFDGLSMRLSLSNSYQDGFRKNVSKNVTNTNKRKESLYRLKLNYSISENLNVLSTILLSDLQNGYDVWAPDNNENFQTYTNDDGEDSQRTFGYSVKGTYNPSESIQLTSITSFTETDLVHAYDGDWADSLYWHDNHGFDPAVEGWSYEFFDKNRKNRINLTQEIRTKFKSLILGGYFKHLEEKDEALGYLFGGAATDASSHYDFISTAAYSQLTQSITPTIKLTGNVRYELNQYDYTGSSFGINDNWEKVKLDPVRFKTDYTMLGYRASLLYEANELTRYFASISQGYKSGGVNQQPYLSDENRPFDPEYIKNYEIGIRNYSANHRLIMYAFFSTRTDQQVSISSQQVEGDPNSFLFYTTNAGSGQNYGFELDYARNLSNHIELTTSLSHLSTHVDKFEYKTSSNTVEKSGDRASAMSPEYMGSIGLNYSSDSGVRFSLNTNYKHEYYFSDSHDEKSDPYQLTNLTIGKTFGKMEANIWVRNLTDERYATRGFYFGLVPPDYPDQLWKSFGDPRQIGLSLKYNF